MSSPARILLASLTAVLACLFATACNNTDVRNRTIPPIAGVTVGGPTAQNGAGQVSVSVNDADANVIAGQQIQLDNITRGGTTSAHASGTTDLLFIPGDVGDTLRITLPTHDGLVQRDYEVTRPTIAEISSGAGGNVVITNQVSAIIGNGFCTEASNDLVLIDGVTMNGGNIESSPAPAPGEIHYLIPATLDTSMSHTLTVVIDGADGADVKYASEPFVFTAKHPG